MKAVICTHYGSPEVLQLREVDRPTPKDNEVLIKVHAATVTKGDCEIRGMTLPILFRPLMRLYLGLRGPRRTPILGMEVAGEVAEVGKAVTRFKVGDPIFGSTGIAFGAYAEYVSLPETPDDAPLIAKPAALTYEEAAALPVGGLEALHFMRKANLQPGQKILINGAGGSIGTFAIQLAKYFGAEVTAVDSTPKLDMMRAIGADHVIDYTREDFTRRGQTYDVILDVVGKSPYTGSIRSLKDNGLYFSANPSLIYMFRGLWTSMTSAKKTMFGASSMRTEDLMFLKDLIEAGTIKTIIDRRYPLEQIVQAHDYVEKGLKRGNVVITVSHPA